MDEGVDRVHAIYTGRIIICWENGHQKDRFYKFYCHKPSIWMVPRSSE